MIYNLDDNTSVYTSKRTHSEYHRSWYTKHEIIEEVIDAPVLTSNSISGVSLSYLLKFINSLYRLVFGVKLKRG